MKKTRLDLYKGYFGCQHNGETVLKAGEQAFFPSDPHGAPLQSIDGGGITNRFQSHELLEQIGIQPEMTAPEITALARKKLRDTVAGTDHMEGREEMAALLKAVLDFCEDPVTDAQD